MSPCSMCGFEQNRCVKMCSKMLYLDTNNIGKLEIICLLELSFLEKVQVRKGRVYGGGAVKLQAVAVRSP